MVRPRRRRLMYGFTVTHTHGKIVVEQTVCKIQFQSVCHQRIAAVAAKVSIPLINHHLRA